MRTGELDIHERYVREYLESLDLGPAVFEPAGEGTFPDFLVNDQIAVEATRLVKRLSQSAGQSLETILPSLTETLKNAIESVVLPEYEVSYFVTLRIGFPIEARPAARNLKSSLREFLDSSFKCNG